LAGTRATYKANLPCPRHLQAQIGDSDKQINQIIKNIIDKSDNKKQHIADKNPFKRKTKTGSATPI